MRIISKIFQKDITTVFDGWTAARTIYFGALLAYSTSTRNMQSFFCLECLSREEDLSGKQYVALTEENLSRYVK